MASRLDMLKERDVVHCCRQEPGNVTPTEATGCSFGAARPRLLTSRDQRLIGGSGAAEASIESHSVTELADLRQFLMTRQQRCASG